MSAWDRLFQFCQDRPAEDGATDKASASPRLGWRHLSDQVARLVGRSEEAEDLLHTAYERLEAYGAKVPVENPRAFLLKTAQNLTRDARRLRDRRPQSSLDDVCESALMDPTPLPDEVMAARQRLAHVRAGLDELPHRTREVFLLHRLQGLKYREIAERLGISQSAVEKHIAKAALFLGNWMQGW